MINFHGFRLAFRHLMRQKLNTVVHIVGLTLGISACVLIGLFLRYELSFDNYHANADQIYRINSIWFDAGRTTHIFSTPIPLADALRKEVSGIGGVAFAHPVWESRSVVEITAEKKFKQEHMLIVEPSYAEIFRIERLSGDPYATLRKPYTAVLTKSTAIKFYGNENPIGKVFKLNNEFEITVGAVIRDIPSNSHQPASLLLSYVHDRNFIGTDTENWTTVSGGATYVVIPRNSGIQDLQAHLDRIANKYANSGTDRPHASRSSFDIQPLHSIHFESKYSGGSEWVKAVDSKWLWVFAAIGASVLFLACINFINLSTAQALSRAKEVGVLKTIGAGVFHLMMLFLREAWLLVSVAGLLSIGVVQVTLPYMNEVLNKQIELDLMESPALIGVFISGIFLTGLLAGIYPAYLITRFNPAATLKSGPASSRNGSSWIRHALVVTQFTIAAGLLIVVMIIAQQVDFMRSRSLGFDRNNILKVDITNARRITAFKAELKRIPGVEDVAYGTSSPSDGGHWGTSMSTSATDDKSRQPITLLLVDDNYCKMYGLKLLAGRFPESSDSTFVSANVLKEQQVIKAVVNEKTVHQLGYKSNEAALHERFWIGMNGGNAEIVGVVADFNTVSLHEPIKPALITINYNYVSQAGIKLASGIDVPGTITAIEAAWRRTFPEGIFQFTFLDQQIDSFYKSEVNLYSMFRVFAGIAMLISCLGLWGLSMYATQQRTKEIGVRKVLGASLHNIVVLLSRDLLALVLAAVALAAPLALYLVSNWLNNFAFQVPITWTVFALAACTSVAIALITVCIHAVRAGMANPTESLKSE